ncbi:MAG: hypothetical protein HDT16_08315 [Oscillibacter sp.]|nr:hypothetical protein [Oscillibacter sp.]
MKKRIISRALALFMALSLLSTTAFAASFTNLQDAINDKGGTRIEGTDRYGYGSQNSDGIWGIEAWNSDDGTRNVQLNEDVTYKDGGLTKDATYVNIQTGKDVTLNMNGNTIDTGNRFDENGDVTEIGGNQAFQVRANSNLTINGAGEDGERGTITGGYGNNGGAIFAYAGASITLNDVNLTGNSVKANGKGGAVCASGNNSVILNNVDLTGNSAAYGGAISAKSGSVVTLNNVNLTGNSATTGGVTYASGGAIYAENSDVTLKDVNLTGNSSTFSGGAIRGTNSKVTLENVTMTGNKTLGHGAAIQADGGATVTMKDVTISNNSAAIDGGAINTAEETVITVRNTTMTGNTAGNDGGALWIGRGSVVSIDGDSKIVGNYSQVKADGSKMANDLHIGDVEQGAPDVTSADSLVYNGVTYEKVTTDASDGFDIVYAVPENSGEPDSNIPDDGNDSTDGNDSSNGNTSDTTTPDVSGTDTAVTATGADAVATTTIEDDEVPLAGLLTLADLLEELRQYEEIAEIELPEDFKWVDHEYAQAIYWGLQEELVVDTEDDPLDPDEVLTVGLMREVLTNFVEIYVGLDDFVVELEGEDEDLVMDYIDMISRLGVFYDELDAALEAKAA